MAAPTSDTGVRRDAKFTFRLTEREFAPLKHKETVELLKKW